MTKATAQQFTLVTNADSDKRDSKRVIFYRKEFPPTKIIIGSREIDGEVYDLSTNGVGIIPAKEIPGLDSIGQEVFLRFGNSKPRRATLQNISHVKFSGSFHVKFGFNTYPLPDLQELLEKPRYDCTLNAPMGYCDDPIAFNRTLLFNAIYFSTTGVGIRTRNEDTAFYPGQHIDLKLMLPARGEHQVITEIYRVTKTANYIDLDCVWTNASTELLTAISEFILMTASGATIDKLRDEGFFVADIERAYLFRNASGGEQMNRIMELRLKAAQADGRWVGETNLARMLDPWDKFARQIYCEINGRTVAAGRVVFNNGLKERSEHQSYGVKIPEWLWQEGFVESSRLCTDPEYRNADLFFLMLQHISRVILQSGHRYLLLNCVDNLVPVYEKSIGVKRLNQRFHTEFMQDRALNLLYLDVRNLQLGLNTNVGSWVISEKMGSALIDRGQIKLNAFERVVRPVYRVLHKIIARKHDEAKFARESKRLAKLKDNAAESGDQPTSKS